jgi:hypothetical protein
MTLRIYLILFKCGRQNDLTMDYVNILKQELMSCYDVIP